MAWRKDDRFKDTYTDYKKEAVRSIYHVGNKNGKKQYQVWESRNVYDKGKKQSMFTFGGTPTKKFKTKHTTKKSALKELKSIPIN